MIYHFVCYPWARKFTRISNMYPNAYHNDAGKQNKIRVEQNEHTKRNSERINHIESVVFPRFSFTLRSKFINWQFFWIPQSHTHVFHLPNMRQIHRFAGRFDWLVVISIQWFFWMDALGAQVPIELFRANFGYFSFTSCENIAYWVKTRRICC